MNAEIEQLRAEVQALTMLVMQQGDAQNGAGGPDGGFFPIGMPFGSGGGGGGGDVTASGIVAVSVDYITSTSDPDYEAHPYAIRIKRGRLKANAGVISVEQDDELTQYIETTPYTGLVEGSTGGST